MFERVQINHVGFFHRKNTFDLDRTQVFSPGIYLVGLNAEFIQWPTTWQSIYLDDIGVGTSQGGGYLSVDIQVYYRLNTEKLFDLYDTLGENYDHYHLVATNQATKGVRNTASTFTSTDYFVNREAVRLAMQDAIAELLSVIHIDLIEMRLMEVKVDSSLESAIIRKVTEVQGRLEAIEDGNRVEITSTNAYDVSLIDLNTQLALTNAEATAIVTNAEASAAAFSTQVTAEAAAYEEFQSDLGLTSQETLHYVWSRVLRKKASLQALVGFEDANTGVASPI